MSALLLPLFVAIPLLVAGALTAVPMPGPVRRATLFLTLMVLLAGSGWLVWTVRDGAVLAEATGNWPAGIAIPFAGDMFSALMLTATGLLTILCASFAIQTADEVSRFFAPLLLVLTAGVNGALLTADLFNLFVFIEVMLLPSYGLFLLARPGHAQQQQVHGTRLYVTVNLLTSTVFLAGVGLLYGTAGTVNLAELAGAGAENGLTATALGLCLFALAVKAAVVPVHGWLPAAYTATTPAITALFSGLHTKVAIYALYRIYSVAFDGDTRYLWIGLLFFGLTMLVGAVAAAGKTTTRSILSFQMVSGIGYILLGVALSTGAGLAAGIAYLLHHMVVMAALFLITGAIEVRSGTARLSRLGGLAVREPLLATAFFLVALSLVGVPPFSGFVAKYALVVAALADGQGIMVAVILVASLITLLTMLRLWSGVFWGATPDASDPTPCEPLPSAAGATGGGTATATRVQAASYRVGLRLQAPALVLTVLTIALGLGGEVLLDVAGTAATGLLDTTAYVEGVLGG